MPPLHKHKLEDAVELQPSWDALYVCAEAQAGCFTTEQAIEAGFSNQLLNRHLNNGNFERLYRGIYRLTRFPAVQRDQEDLMVAWLWSARSGVFSHETALQLHGLSDALPSGIHLTVPSSWAHRRVRVPPGVQLSFHDLHAEESAWVGSVPVTTPARTIADVARAHGDASIVEQAARQALSRKLVTLAELLPAVEYLAAGPR